MHNLTWILFTVCVLAIVHVNESASSEHSAPQPKLKFTRAGCFVDARGRDLKAKRYSSVRMTREKCNRFCLKNNFKYGAVQQG